MVDQITKRGGKAIAVQANLAKAKIETLFAATKKAFGKFPPYFDDNDGGLICDGQQKWCASTLLPPKYCGRAS